VDCILIMSYHSLVGFTWVLHPYSSKNSEPHWFFPISSDLQLQPLPHLFDLLIDHLPGLFVLDALRNLPNSLTIAPQNQIRIDLAPGVSLEITQQKKAFSMGNMVINYEILRYTVYPMFNQNPCDFRWCSEMFFSWTTPDFIQTFCSSFCGFSPILDSKVSLVQCTFHREPKGNRARESSSSLSAKMVWNPKKQWIFCAENMRSW